MIQSTNDRGRRSVALAAAATFAITGTLLVSAGPAVAGKPKTQLLLEVGPTKATATCSVTFDVTNPNSSGQRIEIGAENTSTFEKVYSTTRIDGDATKTVVVSVPGTATYVGFAANSAGRTYSSESATVNC
jgi:hypothetical protein